MLEIDRKIPDYLGSYSNSLRLARAIRKYWRDRGNDPEVFVETFTLGPDDNKYYQVRSNINLVTVKDQ